ncbi:MAG: cell division protein FtsZ [Flavobacteriaceae bacterium]|nr:cell division protein FtsZ [Flavobacteriaceae bacterium]
MDLHFNEENHTPSNNIIKVVGIGGAGNNAVNHMYKYKVEGIDYVVCNTDIQDLQDSAVPHKLQIGVRLTEGLGAGSIPQSGKDAAEESESDIKKMLSGATKMVVLAAGMGGGTGTGASPVIARIAQDMGLVVVSIVTTPFGFERQRLKEAVAGIETLEKVSDAILIINNQKLQQMYGDLSFPEACDKANDVLVMAAKSISEIVTETAEQNIDYSDLEARLKGSGMAVFGVGRAKGEGRVEEAINEALYSPLLDNCDILGAKSLLVNIVLGSENMSVAERQKIGSGMRNKAGGYSKMKVGLRIDKSLEEDEIVITIIATNFSNEPRRFNEIENVSDTYPVEEEDDFMELQNTREIEAEAKRKAEERKRKKLERERAVREAREREVVMHSPINEVEEDSVKKKPSKDPIGDLIGRRTKGHHRTAEKDNFKQGILNFFTGADVDDVEMD